MATGAPDPQKRRLYAWEDGFRSFDEPSLLTHEVERVVRRCCRRYGVPSPAVRFMPWARREWSYHEVGGKRELIVFNRQHCNHAIACHEAAHAICHARFGAAAQDHGPEFVGVYLDLLILHSVAPRVALEASLRAKRLTWKTVRRARKTA
jgi:hypothetical protein